MNSIYPRKATRSFVATPAAFGQTKGSQSLMCADLRLFLRDIANTPLKVRILHLFLTQSGVCISSGQLADRIESVPAEVRAALQELNYEGALMFCPHFGHSDLCLMNPRYQTDSMKENLRLLLCALREAPETVWSEVEKTGP